MKGLGGIMKWLMSILAKLSVGLFVFGSFFGFGYLVYNYYGVLFSKTIKGEIFRVERVNTNVALLSSGAHNPPSQIFSFAVGIREQSTGQIWTASSEDRQWAVVKEGLCAEAEFLPYPPWDLTKRGTYHGARLIRLYECEKH